MSSSKVINAHMMMIEVSLLKDQQLLSITFADGLIASVPFPALKLSKEAAEGVRFHLPNPYELEIHVGADSEPKIVPWTLPRSFADSDYERRIETDRKQQQSALADKIRSLREQQGLTQEALAQAAGLSRMSISRIERNQLYQPNVRTLQRLAAVLNCRIADLFSASQEGI